MRKFLLLLIMVLLSSNVVLAGLEIKGEEKFIYQVTDGKIQYQEEVIYQNSTFEGKNAISYVNIAKKGNEKLYEWNVVTDAQASPFKIDYYEGNSEVNMVFDGEGRVKMTGNWKDEQLNLTNNFKKNVTLENALILRNLNLDSNKKYVFDLLQREELPKLKAYEMYFKVVGNKTVTVSAGTFDCKKVLFSLTDWRGFFYKAYYYVTNDNHRYIVKIENSPKDVDSELISIN